MVEGNAGQHLHHSAGDAALRLERIAFYEVDDGTPCKTTEWQIRPKFLDIAEVPLVAFFELTASLT